MNLDFEDYRNYGKEVYPKSKADGVKARFSRSFKAKEVNSIVENKDDE